jgi:hypothetical protein
VERKLSREETGSIDGRDDGGKTRRAAGKKSKAARRR